MWNSWKTYGSANCAICGDLFVKKIIQQKLCGKPACRKANQKRIYAKSWRKHGKDWYQNKLSSPNYHQRSQAKYRTSLEKLLSLSPAQMSMEDHWVKGYYLKHKHEGMEPQEAYERAVKDLKAQKLNISIYRDTIPIAAVVPEEPTENAAKAS